MSLQARQPLPMTTGVTPDDVLRALGRDAREVARREARIAENVAEARRVGWPWKRIAQALGRPSNSVYCRYRHLDVDDKRAVERNEPRAAAAVCQR